MASSSRDDRVYDVFLSFGGEDTRRTFTDHLYCTLEDHQFNVFMYGDEYDYKLEKSNGAIPEHRIQEIERSKVAVVVFSRGYPESVWCLEELVKIMECRRTLGQMFFPIFYDVDPSDVLNQSGSFAEAFQKHELKIKEEKVHLWRNALKEAGLLAGLNFRETDGHEGNFIRNVISQITGKLSITTCLEVPTSLVGIDSRAREISKHLDVGGSNDVRIIGILGMCGLGKTTVAKAVFNKHHHSFDSASFVQNAREKNLVDLQEQLLSDILKPAYIVVSSINEGIKEIEQGLGNRRVLVVIDHLDSVEQIYALAIKPDAFGPGSRIIITSRNEHLLKILNVDKICPLPAMNEREALELLSWHAFRKNYPNEVYVELSRKAVGYCGGLPLALEVLGSYLWTKSTSEWETVFDKWNRSQPYREIHRRLEISYDGLTDDDVKAIFLDISCFFTGMNKDYVMTVLDGCRFYPEIGIQELQDQCLVTVDKEGNLMMHDLIQGMGREIVHAESPDKPGKRSRLWHNEDITDVLLKESGTEDVEGLAFDTQEFDACSFSSESFRNMRSLRLLKLNYIKLTGSYHNLSKELRWLCWHGFPLKVIPDDFDQPNLVAIDLTNSKLIRVWEDTDVLLKNLKIINLSHSHYLTESPDFSKVPNLEELILAKCRSLSQIHPSIGHLEKLSLVNLEGCKTLQYFPGDFYKSKSVKTLILNDCSRFRILNDSLGQMVSLTTLKANHTMISQGPSSIVRLKNLVSLFLWGLRGSPSSNLLRPSLTFLGLGNCNITDDSIPKDLGSLFSLEILELDGNLFCSLPSLSGLSKLKMLDLSYCKDLLEIPDLPRSLEILRANQCIALAKLPNFSEMSSMVELHLNLSPKLTEILGLHKSLNTMRRIHMEGCTNLTAAFRKNILQGWTSCGHGDIFLNGIYDIPEWFQFVDIREPNDVHFKVPQIIGRNFRGLTVCCIFETCCPGFTVTNITKGKALHIWEESTCWVAASVLRLQSVLSNDVLHLQSGDEVSISAVTEAHGRGRVMKTGFNLVWDHGDGGDAYSSNDEIGDGGDAYFSSDEIGAVPSSTSSDETLPSPSVHTGGCPPMAWAPFARSIFSLRRDQLNSMETHGLSGGGGGGSGGLNLDSFQILVADCFLQLSSPHDLLSLPWLRDLLNSLLRIHQEFRTLLILSSTKTHISKPTVDRYISNYFERSVKALDVCNAIRNGIEEIRQWLKLLDIVLVALGEGQFRRAKKALVNLAIAMLDDKDSNTTIAHRNLAIAMLDDKDSSNTTIAHRNRSFGRNNTKDHHHQQHRSLGHFRSLSWSVTAARQLQAIGNNLYAPRPNEIVASSGLAQAVFTINSVLLFVMWALVAAIPCQDRGLQVHFNVPRSFVWAGSMLSLHDRIMDESKRRDRRNACALLKEIRQIERCSWVIGDLADSAHFPLAEAKEKEVRERVQELSSLCEGIKEGLDPLERQVREVFHGIVKSRTEGMDSYGRANNPE